MFSGRIVYKSFSSNPDYFVLCGDGVRKLLQDATESDYAIGECVFFDGSAKGGEVSADAIRLAEENEEAKVAAEAELFLERTCRAFDVEPLVEDVAMRKMLPAIKTAAIYAQRKICEMAPIILRHDSDPDGICSALMFRKALRNFAAKINPHYPERFVIAKAADSPIYEMKNLTSDAETAADFAKKPLIALFDHGANVESERTVMSAKESGFELFFMDHHPYSDWTEKNADCFIDALQFGGTSSHCTGLLAWHLAKAICGTADENPAWWAMQADRSSFAKKETFPEPIAMDYLATKDTTLNQYEKIFADKHLIGLSYQKAVLLRRKALAKAQQSCKRLPMNGGELLLLEISGFTEKYPPKGGFVQQLHELHEPEARKIVTIGHDRERVIFRANAAANEAGFKANLLIEKIKSEFPNAIASGGGHERASSMRVREGFSTSLILERVIELAKQMSGG